MRLLFDECVDVGLAVPLRAAGHDVAFVQDIEPSASDDRVMQLAMEHDRWPLHRAASRARQRD